MSFLVSILLFCTVIEHSVMGSARGCPGSTCISPVWLERCKPSLSLLSLSGGEPPGACVGGCGGAVLGRGGAGVQGGHCPRRLPPPAPPPPPPAPAHAGRAAPPRRCLQACRRGPDRPEPDSEPGPSRTSSAVTWRAAPRPGWAPDARAYKHRTGFASAAS